MEPFSALMTLLILVLALYLAWALNSPHAIGARGERRVHNRLLSTLDPANYRVLRDITIPSRGGTTQIDNIVVSRFGIFVIETKNMKGWIFGAADQATWTQVIYGKKTRFQNPMRQNFKHIKAIEELLRVDPKKVFGAVAFVGSAEPKTPMPFGVLWGSGALRDYILSWRREVFTSAEVQRYTELLSSREYQASSDTRKAHVRNVRTATVRNSQIAGKCPACGSRMVLRTNRSSGADFLGCSRYPKCRGTRRLE